MTQLTNEHAAADGTAPLLSGEEAHVLLEEIPQWYIREKKLRRDVRVTNFSQALALLNQIGNLAEAENHHPDLYLHSWNHLSVEFYTHTVDGLSRNDFILAAKCSQILEKSS
ncbi:MAG: 4a-hydroxytetrahydrobiopterin dehydratase [Chloroflexota bacterium]